MDAWNLDRFEAFLFDMDGVLTDSMPNHYEAWRQTFAFFGISVSREEVLRREGEQGMVTLRTVLSRHGHHFEPHELFEILKRKETIFRSFPKPSLFEGAEELVDTLRGKGKRLGLVTGTSLAEAKDNMPSKLFRCFDTVVSGDQVRQGKPAPEPYLKAMKKLGVSQQVSLVIENAPYGILSAKRAGLKCVAVTTSLPPSYLTEADRIVADLVELRNLLFS